MTKENFRAYQRKPKHLKHAARVLIMKLLTLLKLLTVQPDGETYYCWKNLLAHITEITARPSTYVQRCRNLWQYFLDLSKIYITEIRKESFLVGKTEATTGGLL